MRKIRVFDTTLRDGEQSAGVNLNASEKLEIAKQLERLGVDVMEAGFPASSHGDFQAVQTIAKTIKNSAVAGMARATVKDIDAAWDALQYSVEPTLHIFLATSPIHMKHKLRMTPDKVLETAVSAVKHAKRNFPQVEFTAEDGSRTDMDFLVKIVTEVIDAGATIINIADTVGYISPIEYASFFRTLKENVPNIHKAKLSAHCHDDLGLAVANTLSAIEAGVDQIEGTINGIGERAGNASLEEIVVALRIREDYYKAKTGLHLNEIKRTSSLVSKLTGMVIPPNKAVVGANAFAHESGIHQDGILKEKSTYEIITPELIGVSSNRLVLGKHSGRHAFKQKVNELGFSLDEEQFSDAFLQFKSLSDRKKMITDEDLLSILTEKQVEASDQQIYELQSIQVQYGTMNTPTATVALKIEDGSIKEEAATGSGSVEAIYNTIERIIDKPLQLKDYSLHTVGAGRDALVEVFVKVTMDGTESTGRGIAQDILEASSKAYVNAVNRIIHLKQDSTEATSQQETTAQA